MKQHFAHFERWEDYQNGMYCGTVENDNTKIELAKSLLRDPSEFYNTLQKVLREWPVATLVNLTNIGINRRAWLGQAACSYKYQVPEIMTRIAWGELNEIQRFEANSVAEKVIAEYLYKQLNLFEE